MYVYNANNGSTGSAHFKLLQSSRDGTTFTFYPSCGLSPSREAEILLVMSIEQGKVSSAVSFPTRVHQRPLVLRQPLRSDCQMSCGRSSPQSGMRLRIMFMATLVSTGLSCRFTTVIRVRTIRDQALIWTHTLRVPRIGQLKRLLSNRLNPTKFIDTR